MATRTPAAARARRLLAILHLFEPYTEVRLSDIAQALAVPSTEIAEDLSMLACCGLSPYTPEALVPLYLEDGVVRVFGELPALDRAVRLSAREVRALAAALELAGVPVEAPLMRRLLAAAASPDISPEEVARLLAVAAGAPVGDLLGDLALARTERRCVSIVYQAGGREETTERVVEPLGLVNDQGTWYLEAYCRRAGALRTFRVDRIRDWKPLDEVFPPRGISPTGSAFVTDGLPLARVRFAPNSTRSLANALRDWPGARMESERGNVLLVPYAGTGWLARQVVALLGDAEVLEPREVRSAVRELAESELAALDVPAA